MVEKGTLECHKQCHLGGCADEIAFACTCDDRLLVEPGRIVNDTRKNPEEPERISTANTMKKMENMEQIIQTSLIQTISERGEFEQIRRFDI